MSRDKLGPRRATIWSRIRISTTCLIGVHLAIGVVAASAYGPGNTRYAEVQHVCPAPTPGDEACFALIRKQVPSSDAARPGVHPYTLGDGASQSGPAGGLAPAQLATGYGYAPTAGGTGQTVAIVDAYDDPAIESDLAKFDSQYGIAPCTQGSGCFTKVSQTGTSFLPEADTSGWSVEITLDVETVHSVCPNCKILLVEAKNPSTANLAAAVNEAVKLGATEISNSYGGPEGLLGTTELNAYNHPGVVIAAATGDDGYYDWTVGNEGEEPPSRPNVPATLPTVVSVGGTSLTLDEAGTRAGETVWNGNGPFDSSFFAEGAGGGGCSTMFTAPLWQRNVPGFSATGCGSKRLAADVSAVADPLTGFDIYDSYNCGTACEEFKRGSTWLTIGGTSLSTPLISALYALAGGAGGVEYPALTLYGHIGSAALYDVTEGGNGFCDDEGFACGANSEFGVDVDCEGTTACNAATGYDGPSGVGTPDSLALFSPLLPRATISAPNESPAGSAIAFSGSGSNDPFPGASIERYVWNWGDGTANGSGPAPTHSYVTPGEYRVTLTVVDDYGQSSHTTTASIAITPESGKEEGKGKEEEGKGKEEGGGKGEEGKGGGGSPGGTGSTGSSGGSTLGTSPGPGSGGVAGIKQSSAPAPTAHLAGSSLQVGPSGSFAIKISCSAGASSCSGTVVLRTLVAVAASRKRVLTLASGSFTVAAGKVAKVTLRLSKRGRIVLARSGRLRARVTIQLASHPPVLSLVTLHALHRH
jgi:hypothetical protein